VATASPPTPPTTPPPPGVPRGALRAPSSHPARIAAAAALVLAVLVVALLVLGGGGGANYHLIFGEAGQLVRGDQVQVGGVPVGSVTNIELTNDFKAKVTIHVDSSLTPLHEGTVAQVRQPSLSSVANRYVNLSPGPNNKPALANGATLPASSTKEIVDLDTLFNTLDPKTRKGLQGFIQGQAEQYGGEGANLGEATAYFGPFLSASDHFFAELARDQPVFTNFLVETAKAVTTIGARKEQLSDLIENANTTFTQIGSQQHQFAQALKELPRAVQQGNKTFAELPSTFKTLEKLIDASKPTSKPLTTLFSKLHGLVVTGTPAITSLSNAFSRPGASNDLTDLARALPALARQLTTTVPPTITALKESIPVTAFFGPYAPELAGTARTLGQAASYYDANGHYVRFNPVFPDFELTSENTLVPTTSAKALAALKTEQLRRCPGGATQPAADKSSPFEDEGKLSCDPAETP
jgi:phospholipid/cholesterol/gamma-HCH transport system substrate-binding protein